VCDPISALAIRIVLAEDNYLVHEGVRGLLETQDDLEVVATCDSLDSLLGAVEAERPDVVLTDIRMPPGGGDEGIQAAARLRETRPEIGVVVLSQFSFPDYALALLGQGADRHAYLLKERVNDLEELVAAIHEVAAGGSAIDPKVIESLVAAGSRREDSPLETLTPRERETLAEMVRGKTTPPLPSRWSSPNNRSRSTFTPSSRSSAAPGRPDVHRRVKAVLVFLAEQRH
jgi:DNA-binding NarL/FixJ family response regulator